MEVNLKATNCSAPLFSMAALITNMKATVIVALLLNPLTPCYGEIIPINIRATITSKATRSTEISSVAKSITAAIITTKVRMASVDMVLAQLNFHVN